MEGVPCFTTEINHSFNAFSLPTAQPKRTSKYAVAVAPVVLVDIAVKKTIEQHKTDGANGYTIVANADMADHTHDLSGTHTHFPKDRAQALVTAEETAKNRAEALLDLANTQVTSLLDLIAELKATHGSTVASAPLTHDGTLDGMLNAAKVGAGNITLTDNSVVNVATAGNAALIAILTGADLNDKEALLVALRAAPAWTHDAGEEDDLTKTIYLRSVINR